MVLADHFSLEAIEEEEEEENFLEEKKERKKFVIKKDKTIRGIIKMPADVAAMHTNFLQFNKSSLKDSNVDSCWNTENMSGYMTLVGPNGQRQGVQVKVYRTSVEHFAVIYPQKKVCRPLGVLNLRNMTIERLADEGFLVRQKGFDSPVALTFLMENKKELDYWIMAFTARTSPLVHQSSLPIVEEEEI